MSRIFISYRRDDSAADMTDRLYERLVQRWGGRVFMDIDSLVGGDLFEKAIEENLQNCSVMLVIIGRQWATLTNEKGLRRIDDPRDYPRMEVAAALRRGVRVIPVLVGGAQLPRREELPQEIAGLVDRHYVRISRERFAADSQHLIEAVASEMPRRSWLELRWQTVATVAAMAVAAGATAYFALVDDAAKRGVPSATEVSPAKVEAPGPLTKAAQTGQGAELRDEKMTAAKSPEAAAKREDGRSSAPVNISGRWMTAPINAAYGNVRFTLQFEFTQLDDTLRGTVTETGEGLSRGISRAILEGKIKNNVISFHTKGESIVGTDGTIVPYKEMYVGTVHKDGREIAFRRFNDATGGGQTEAFVAAR